MAGEEQSISENEVGALPAAPVNRFNVRVSGQIEGDSFEDVCAELARALQAAADGKEPISPLVQGGIFRITPAEGA